MLGVGAVLFFGLWVLHIEVKTVPPLAAFSAPTYPHPSPSSSLADPPILRPGQSARLLLPAVCE